MKLSTVIGVAALAITLAGCSASARSGPSYGWSRGYHSPPPVSYGFRREFWGYRVGPVYRYRPHQINPYHYQFRRY